MRKKDHHPKFSCKIKIARFYYRSIHISASLPQWLHTACPLVLLFFSGTAGDSIGVFSCSSREQVIIISASFPQFSHLQTCLNFFSAIVSSLYFKYKKGCHKDSFIIFEIACSQMIIQTTTFYLSAQFHYLL